MCFWNGSKKDRPEGDITPFDHEMVKMRCNLLTLLQLSYFNQVYCQGGYP